MDEVTELLKEAIALELNGVQLYNYLAANVSGINRAILKPMFDESATESLDHATSVRMWLKRLIGQDSSTMVVADIVAGDLPLPGSDSGVDFVKAAIEQEGKAVKLYEQLYKLLNKEQSDIALLNWVQAQCQIESEDLFEYQCLLNEL